MYAWVYVQLYVCMVCTDSCMTALDSSIKYNQYPIGVRPNEMRSCIAVYNLKLLQVGSRRSTIVHSHTQKGLFLFVVAFLAHTAYTIQVTYRYSWTRQRKLRYAYSPESCTRVRYQSAELTPYSIYIRGLDFARAAAG